MTAVSEIGYRGRVPGTAIREAAPLRAVGGREMQRLRTRSHLVAVALEEFRRTGFAATDIARIATAAGVSRGTFYFHFPTKDHVLAELRIAEEQRIVGEVSSRAGKRPLAAVLAEIVAGIEDAERRLGTELVQQMCAMQFRPDSPSSSTVSDHPLAQFVVDAIIEADAGSHRDPSVLGVVFLSALFGLLSTADGPGPERAERIDLLIALTSQGANWS